MRITQEKAYRNTFVAEYDDLSDFARSFKNRKYPEYKEHEGSDWAGGTSASMLQHCESGDESYAARSEKLVDRMADVAIQGAGIDMEYNLVNGVLDAAAMHAGNPACMYGMTMTDTDRSPVCIYVDTWISSTIPKAWIVRRGVAVLALVQALTVHRPVITKMMSASGASFDRNNDSIQIVPVPTHPMDLSRAAWMLASVEFTRVGFYSMVNHVHDMPGYDCGPLMGAGNGKHWQATQLGKWMAERDGVTDHVFLPLMFHGEHTWSSDSAALDWVNAQVARFVNNPEYAAA